LETEDGKSNMLLTSLAGLAAALRTMGGASS
jgi:hypothetical protein